MEGKRQAEGDEGPPEKRERRERPSDGRRERHRETGDRQRSSLQEEPHSERARGSANGHEAELRSPADSLVREGSHESREVSAASRRRGEKSDGTEARGVVGGRINSTILQYLRAPSRAAAAPSAARQVPMGAVGAVGSVSRMEAELAAFRRQADEADSGASEGELQPEGNRPIEAAAAAPSSAVAMPTRSRWLDEEDSADESEGGSPVVPAQGSMAHNAPLNADREAGVSEGGCGLQPGAEVETREAEGVSEPNLSQPASVYGEEQPNVASRTGVIEEDETRTAAHLTPAAIAGGGGTSFTGAAMPAGRSCRSVDSFQKLNKIDEGAYGVVYRARCRKSGDIVALKQVKLPNVKEGFPVTALREINLLLSLKHPNIVNCREMVVGNTMDKIFMVMDFMEHDLKGLMNVMKEPFTASEVKRLMKDLLEALEYCHEHWVLHRDLKTSNLLMNNQGRVAIADFGLARRYADPLKEYTNMVVTLWYRAPELLLGGRIYGAEIDVWSMGCIFGELILQEPLLPGRGESDQISQIFSLLGSPDPETWPESQQLPVVMKAMFRKQPFNRLRLKFKRGVSFTRAPAISDEGLNLMEAMLTLNPNKRITAKDALKHPYFSEQPQPAAYELMPTWPSTHDGKKREKVKSVTKEDEERFALFHQR
ncbi:hypothetical protein AB1Y20_003744 [Prymnesium parvum]|uniref:Protein kinase domain-containing protein n=1 Tax=Prymnesium parvum TaxID=97485 RepID=A0AB34J5K2_PRYPA